MTQLELDFSRLMQSIYDRAKSECKYDARYFRSMLAELGGVGTAKKLLRSPDVSEGFVQLYLLNRLDLTVEAQILTHPEYWELFDERELDTARRWLGRHGWKAPS